MLVPYLQIRHLKIIKEAGIIFLVKEFKLEWYKAFSDFIQDSENMAAALPEDGKDDELTKLIKRQYESISKTMSIYQLDGNNDNVMVTFGSEKNTCKSEVSETSICCTNGSENIKCERVQKDIEIDIIATFQVNEEFCENLHHNESLIYHLEGSENDTLNVDIECQQCDCGDLELNSSKCSTKGDWVCGGCDCQ